jgi:hypothetical protein
MTLCSTPTTSARRVDLHTHVVPPRWDDWAAQFGGGRWPRLVARDACHATLMTGAGLAATVRAAIESENARRFLGLT